MTHNDNNNGIILYDLPDNARAGRVSCWSYNPWRTRLALNFKGLEYKTEWVEYPDLPARLGALGITPAPIKEYTAPSGITSHTPAYTIPSIRLNGKYMMDSAAIATALEAAHPTPSLQLDHPMQARVKEVLIQAFMPIRGDVIPLIPEHVLSPGSVEYWVRTRTADLGDLATYRKEHGGGKAYEEAHSALQAAAALLKENEGPFFLGREASYADFLWVSFVMFVKRATEEGFQRTVGVDEVLRKHFEACEPWMERDD